MDQVKIGNFIKERRILLNMTQKDLANILFVSDKAISKWETGKCLMDVTILVPLANALDVSVDELLNANEYIIEHKKQNPVSKGFVFIIASLIGSTVTLNYSSLDHSDIYGSIFGYHFLIILLSYFSNVFIHNNPKTKLN